MEDLTCLSHRIITEMIIITQGCRIFENMHKI